MQSVLSQSLIYLVAAVIAVPVSRRLGLGSVLGYLVAGIAIGPVLHIVAEQQTEGLQHYAEFGVVIMLFLIGLQLRLSNLWAMRHRLFGMGGLQVAFTSAAITALGLAFGLPWRQALAVGLILSLSSTAIVLQALSEKNLTRTEGGRAAFSVLLFQDIFALPLLAFLPLLVAHDATLPAEAGHAAVELEGWMRALLIVAAVAAVILAGRFLTNPLLSFLATARMPEVQIAGALLLVVATAMLMEAIGLSAALGTFLAGVVLADSAYRHELESDLGPFKGLLLGLFFITVGASIDLAEVGREPLLILGLTLGVMALKVAMLWPVAALFRLRGRARRVFMLSLGQAGEFGFFLLAFSEKIRLLPGDIASRLLLVISLSMAFTPILFLLIDLFGRRRGAKAAAADAIDEVGVVIVVGLGRFGQVVNRILRATGVRTVVIDNDPEVVASMRRFGIPAYYGDLDRPVLLESAGIAEAAAIVLALDDAERALQLTDYVHRRHPQVRIIARARDRHHVYRLHALGADEQIRDIFDSAVRAGRCALAATGVPPAEVDHIAAKFVEHDRHLLAELAAVWDPNIPPDRNPAYVARAQEQAQAIARDLQSRAPAPPEPRAQKAEAAG